MTANFGSLDGVNPSTSLYQSTTASTKAEIENCNFEFYEGTAIIVINLALSLVGTTGNVLIIFAVLTTMPLRQRSSNFLLLSLAITDLSVTMGAQPLHAISMCFRTYRYYCVPNVDLAYDVMANFFFCCSIFHLSAISIDRVLATLKPHTHQDIMKKRGLKIMLVTCWVSPVIAITVSIPMPQTLLLSISLIVFTYVIVIISYAVILYKITRSKITSCETTARSRKVKRDALMEKRVSMTILIVILCFSISTFPLIGIYISAGNALLLRKNRSSVYMWVRTLALWNSSVNFVIYSYRIDHFRAAYGRILRNIIRKTRDIFGLPDTSPSFQENESTSQTITRSERPKTNAQGSIVNSNLSNNCETMEGGKEKTVEIGVTFCTLPGQL